MVQFFGNSQSGANRLAEALSMGLGEGAQYGVNKGRLSQAFQSLEGLRGQKTDPLSLISALGQAFAGIPGGQQVVSEVYPKLLDYLSKTGGNAPGAPPFQQPGSPNFQQGQGGQQQGAPSPLNQVTNGFNQTSTTGQAGSLPMPLTSQERGVGAITSPLIGEGPLPSQYMPEDIAKEVDDLYSQGYTPEQIRDRITTRFAVNEESRKTLESKLRAYDFARKQAEARKQAQAEFMDFAKGKRNLDTFQEGLFSKIAQKYENAPTQDERYRLANQEFNRIDAKWNNFNKEASRSVLPSNRAGQEKILSNTFEQYFKPLGLYAEAEEALTGAGWGPAETARIINPIPTNTTNQIKDLPKIQSLDEGIKYLPDDPKYAEALQKNVQKRDQTLSKYRDTLKNSIKKGNGVEPGTSLLALREEFSKKGIDWMQFRDMFNEISKDIELDDFQGNELTALSKPPKLNLFDYINPFGGRR